jgi:hypothetical protein
MRLAAVIHARPLTGTQKLRKTGERGHPARTCVWKWDAKGGQDDRAPAYLESAGK